jgi:signal transduction histidine kinase
MERIVNHEDMFVRPDGTMYDVIYNVSPIVRDGARVGSVMDLRDATEERRAREAIQQTLEVKDQFLSLVSHELRTPIATILGNALLLLRRGDQITPENRTQALIDVASESGKLQRIIENLLLLTRMDAGQTLDTEPLRLTPLISQIVTSFQRRHPSRAITVQEETEIPVVLGQPTVLTLLLENLISNADKYSPLEAPIEIMMRVKDGDEVEVCVRDHGIGLEPGEAEAIFTPFYRSDTAKSKAKGIGLGLAVCKRVIEAQGGQIHAESREGGCDFLFTLRRAHEA